MKNTIGIYLSITSLLITILYVTVITPLENKCKKENYVIDSLQKVVKSQDVEKEQIIELWNKGTVDTALKYHRTYFTLQNYQSVKRLRAESGYIQVLNSKFIKPQIIQDDHKNYGINSIK